MPAERAQEAREAHAAWKEFWELACEIARGVKRAPDYKKQLVLEALGEELDTMVGLVRHVIV